jgi:hypothetical protein
MPPNKLNKLNKPKNKYWTKEEFRKRLGAQVDRWKSIENELRMLKQVRDSKHSDSYGFNGQMTLRCRILDELKKDRERELQQEQQ